MTITERKRMTRSNLTPCLVCGKEVSYLWTEEQAGNATNLLDATYVSIDASYGSSYDLDAYSAIICDNCLSAAISSKRVKYHGNAMSGDYEEDTAASMQI